MKQNKGIIENWQVAYQVIPMSMCLTAEESTQTVVVGELDGRAFKSSKVISIIGNELETKNSLYTLGLPKYTYKEIW